MRANVNIARKERRTLTLENFKGVDLSSSPLRVATHRASYMRNLWSENGANHKRPGWRELFALDGKINGVFPFEEDGKEVLLVHAGTKLYRVTHLQGIWAHSELRAGLTDTPSQCFYRDGRAYIIGCGAYLAYGLFDEAYALKDVSEIAYVPTTTVSIDRDDQNDGQVAMLDGVNLLTPWRKNTLVGQTANADSTGGYALDGKADVGTKIKIEIDTRQNGGTNTAGVKRSGSHIVLEGVVEYNENTARNECYFGIILFQADGEAAVEGNGAMPRGRNSSNGYKETNWVMPGYADGEQTDANSAHIAFENCCDMNKKYPEGKFQTGLPWCFEQRGVLTLYLLDLCAEPRVAGESNVTVTFSSAHGGEDKIARSSIGALFDADGGNDRLFLSGNPDEKGLDRWSEAGDFTYFPDGNAMFVGGGESAITGYARLSDGTLGIFKEEVPGYPTIYYRTAAQTTMTDADGYAAPTDYFPVKAGVASDGLVTPRATATLAGDPLILTPTGVYGVELSQNVASGERYTRERSRAIREELCKKDLSGAVAIAYRGRYYLSPGDGTCYVADARYKTTFEGSPDTNYEWWVWDNVPATAFAEYADSLLFGTAQGRVCVFNENIYTDTSYIHAQSGHLTVNADEGYITYGVGIELRVMDSIVLGGVKYTVTRLDEAENRLWLKDEQGNNALLQSGFLTGTFERVQPVVAEWASAVMDLGTSMARKTLLSLGVTLEPGMRGATRISLETRDGAQAFMAQNGHDFDFGALDFGDLSFTGSFAASTTRRMNLRNFNFIRLQMRSDTPTDMAVSGVVLEYKINQANRGYY